MTTAPAAPPTLYGPDGQAIASTPSPAPVGDWKPVRSEAGATVWEKPAPQASPEVEYRERRLAQLEARSAFLDTPAPPREAPAEPAKRSRTRRRWDLDKIGLWAALCFGIGLTASGEYELARFVGFNEWVSALLPAAIDVYVIQAFRRHRDTFVAISLMIATNVLVHLAHNGLFGVVDKVTNGRTVHAPHWSLIAAVSAIAPIIIWRVHRIGGLSNSGHDTDSHGTLTAAQSVPSLPPVESVRVAGESTLESPRESADESARESSHAGPDESADESPGESQRESAESTRKTPDRPRRESAPSRSQRRTTRRRESAPKVSSIGTPESEVAALVALMRERGSADAVTLPDAKRIAPSRSEATAARRLQTARATYGDQN